MTDEIEQVPPDPTPDVEKAAAEYLNEFWKQPLFSMPGEARERARDRHTVMEAFKAGWQAREGDGE